MHYQLSSYRAVPHLNIYHHIFTYTIQLIYRLLYTTYIHITQASKYIHLDNHYFFIYLKSLFNHDASIILYLNCYLFILNYFLIPPISHLFLYSTFQLFILNIHISIYPFIFFSFCPLLQLSALFCVFLCSFLQFICLVHLILFPIYLFTNLLFCLLSIYPIIFIYFHPQFIRLFDICLSVYLPIYLTIQLYLSIHVSMIRQLRNIRKTFTLTLTDT